MTTTVTLLDVVRGDPPAIVILEQLVGRGGRTRSFTQKVPVLDVHLFHRLLEEAQKGDEIEITTETDWNAPGLPTCLIDLVAVIGSMQKS